ncbi:secreted RxLR effector protein 161-like [Cucumis melo]|uniref:Secreted RxLR effector protein 161-like n=1 Tax=Cucumis melo TaxID=3656 RepID=A0A1S4E0Z0_CUCME|nr:secreted RxLR effector protein 161-like [Cucumis melo]
MRDSPHIYHNKSTSEEAWIKRMFIYRQDIEFLIVQIYVDDIIFGGTSSDYVEKFVCQMKGEFEMSMVGELTFFLGFQIRQEATASRPDIAFAVGVCDRYQADPCSSHLYSAKHILKYITGYCDADWDGCSDDQKSTSGGCFFWGTT